MNELSQSLVPTITLGIIYAVVACGFVIIYRAVGILNFAQGTYLLAGALVFQRMIDRGHAVAVSFAVSLLATTLLATATYWFVYRTRMAADKLVLSFSTVGLYIALQAMAILVAGPETKQYPPDLIPGHTWVISSTIRVAPERLFAVTMCVAALIATLLILRTRGIGLRMRAVAQADSLAPYYGIAVSAVAIAAWAVAGALAGSAGVAYSVASAVDPNTLPGVGLAVFPVIILGGLDSVRGAVVGGFLVALLSTTLTTWLGGEYRDLATYGILLVVLIFRPQGLFGTPELARV